MGYAGKRIEEYILDEVRHMLGEIEESNGKPVKDIMETFSLPVVSSLWRVITGERLTRGDAEFQKMLGMVRRLADKGRFITYVTQKSRNSLDIFLLN